MIKLYRISAGVVREAHKTATRSSHWPECRDSFLKSNSKCAACGSSTLLQVHHIEPYHLHPELELEPLNLIVLCGWSNLCHFKLGHGGLYRSYNIQVREDAQTCLEHPDLRKDIEAKARSNRLYK